MEQATPLLPIWRFRPFGHANSQRDVVKTPILLLNINKISTYDNVRMKLFMGWFVHTKFCKH